MKANNEHSCESRVSLMIQEGMPERVYIEQPSWRRSWLDTSFSEPAKLGDLHAYL